MKLDPQIEAQLAEAGARLERAFPELRALMDRARTGQLTDEEAKRELIDLTMHRGKEIEAVLMAPPEDSGLPRLNPTYEAAIAETAQFDGDVPQLRNGPMPKGGKPAVPVLTDARNPVAVGLMLKEASDKVAHEMHTLEKDYVFKVQQAIQDEDWNAVVQYMPKGITRADDLPLEVWLRDSIPDPVGYQRGQVPELATVPTPDGSVLAALSNADRHEAAWQMLSTTQGRRSVTSVIAKLVRDWLTWREYDVKIAWDEAPHEDDFRASWTLDMSGPNAIQPEFAFLDVAAHVLFKKLISVAPVGGYLLMVRPVNAISDRRVGWIATLRRA
jgi:hypothetical protein